MPWRQAERPVSATLARPLLSYASGPCCRGRLLLSVWRGLVMPSARHPRAGGLFSADSPGLHVEPLLIGLAHGKRLARQRAFANDHAQQVVLAQRRKVKTDIAAVHRQ